MEKHLTATQTSYIVAPVPLLITDLKLVSTVAGADNTDNYAIVVSVGGTTIASRQNNAAGGAFVADAVETLTLSNPDKLLLEAGAVIKCVATKNGSAPNMSCRLDFACELARDFS
tara:strand:+ start:314 stop:658 length:345 start_codon:yes stop_codon:yes gene_type:complete